MNQRDAAKILQINGEINPEIVKTAYRKLAMQYHPDRNPAGLELMKLLNVAFDALKDVTRVIDSGETDNLGLTIEICGSWVWVSGNTKPHKEALKAAGYRWNSKKVKWSFRPADYRSYNKGKWSMDQIRATYGSTEVKNRQFDQLQGA